jgi:UDP-N-acetylmuramate--alanine ligase
MKKKCHFIGIGGIGMSGLARLMLHKNAEVTGSDVGSNYITEALLNLGIKIFQGQCKSHIDSEMTVIYSTDIRKDNPEYEAALSMKCRMLHRSDLLIEMMQGYKSFAVTGTHGKTTTSSLLAWTFYKAGLDPSFVIGGLIPQFQSNAKQGSSEYFVVEADESDGTFLKYHPYGAIVTNIDLDHMNYFGSEANLLDSFRTFFRNVTSAESLFWCGDDFRLKTLAPPGISYGFGEECQFRASNLRQEKWIVSYDAVFRGSRYSNIKVPLIGKYNALNSMAVFGMALQAGIEENAIREAFESFQGVSRRCEEKENLHGILMIDDYAHHPTEIRETLKAIKDAVEERRLIAVFQPHRYSRIKACLGQFHGIFEDADELFITDIFGAGEIPLPNVTHNEIHSEIKNNSLISSRYVPRKELANELSTFLRPLDVVVSLGAGDITKLSQELKEKFSIENPSKIKVGVIYGGRSTEHEISLISAENIYCSLNSDYYEVNHFGIAKKGNWISGRDVNIKLKNFLNENLEATENPFLSSEILSQLQQCDIFFPILHGPHGEDGTLQGFFEVLGKPYVGCDHRSSAVCMDKALTKKLAIFNGIATSPFVTFAKEEWYASSQKFLDQILAQLTFPVFVKPVHLGSSIGVRKVHALEELNNVIEKAFFLDTDLIVENGLQAREIEFVVLGDEKIKVFPPGEIFSNGQIYSYDGKYGDNAVQASPQASLTEDQLIEGMCLAEWAYKAAGCNGFARVDFFLDQEGKFWLNEINPIPGCTKNSLFPQICEKNGLSKPQLMDKLITIGLQRWRRQRALLIS